MQKIKVKELVEFHRKLTEKSKKNFALKLKTRIPKEKKKTEEDSGGGDYWTTSTSCIYQVFKQDNKNLLDYKINDLTNRLLATDQKKTKSMYQKNIDILIAFKDFNHKDVLPNSNVNTEKIPRGKKILTIRGFPIEVTPQYVYSFQHKDKLYAGAVWLLPQKNGYKKSELSMFCEMLYRSLKENFSDNFQISTDNCVVIDTYNVQTLSYSEFLSDNYSQLIESTLEEIEKLIQ
ncbi:hypothetical protein [Moheibacter stercoris]|uniref:Uncharacterized protein n=1 Tax=Moheibacter stercoris TaxID=1628251 RepID=A0ABV2LST5_9FLAO